MDGSAPTPALRRKAFAYITWGQALLVFRHVDYPKAGIQVPAGTIEDSETPEDAALREAREETGLARLAIVAFLGEQRYDMRTFGKDEMHHRCFFHLRCTEPPARTWCHLEKHSSESDEVIAFEFFWAPLPDGVPPLIAGHDALLPALLRSMGLAPSP